MRNAWLAITLAGLAGCFNPEAPPARGCTDWCPPPETCIARTCTVDQGALAPNYAFVTSERRVMNGQSVFDLDSWCNDLARAERIPGQFVAWVSTSQMTIGTRLTTLAARGWVRPDGKPFADTVGDIVNGKTYYPLRLAETATDAAVLDNNVATGTESTLAASTSTCSDFMTTGGALVTVGKADAGRGLWTAFGSAPCSEPAHVYCFGVDRANPVTVFPPDAAQKRVFITKNTYTRRTPMDADQICNQEIGGGSKFAALIATATRSVAERFAGSTGPWFRPDGVIASDDMTELAAPLEVAPDGSRVRGQVWFGAATLKDRATDDRSCTDWGVGNSMHYGDSSRSIGTVPFDSMPAGCNAEYHYYCAEL